jgi:hypothetical protein
MKCCMLVGNQRIKYFSFDNSLLKNQEYVRRGRLNFKIYILFYEPLHLDRWSLVLWKVADIPRSFIWIIILFYGAPKCGDSAKFWCYVRTNTEPLCVEFCNSLQCRIFVNHVSSCLSISSCFPLNNFGASWWFFAYYYYTYSLNGSEIFLNTVDRTSWASG